MDVLLAHIRQDTHVSLMLLVKMDRSGILIDIYVHALKTLNGVETVAGLVKVERFGYQVWVVNVLLVHFTWVLNVRW